MEPRRLGRFSAFGSGSRWLPGAAPLVGTPEVTARPSAAPGLCGQSRGLCLCSRVIRTLGDPEAGGCEGRCQVPPQECQGGEEKKNPGQAGPWGTWGVMPTFPEAGQTGGVACRNGTSSAVQTTDGSVLGFGSPPGQGANTRAPNPESKSLTHPAQRLPSA